MNQRRIVSPTRVILATFLLLAGCAIIHRTVDSFISVSVKNYLGIPYVPTDPASIEILRSEPIRPNVRLGEVVVEPQGDPPVSKMEKKIREAAAQMGANAAVIVADATMRMGSIKVGPQWKREVAPYSKETVAVAIRYVDSE